MVTMLEYINNNIPLRDFLCSFLLCLNTSKTEKLFLVGGIVRDSIITSLNKDAYRQLYGINTEKSKNQTDIDLMVTNISYSALGEILDKLMRGDKLGIYNVINVGNFFPVYKVYVKWSREPIDVALARTETSFGSGHREFTVHTDSVTERDDASRRDFTVNSIFLRLSLKNGKTKQEITGKILDYFGGVSSIKRKEIKAILSPDKRFSEDPLRMLRGIRQKVQLGYTIEKETAESILKLIPVYLTTISMERVLSELLKAFLAFPRQALYDFRTFGVFKILFPQIHAMSDESWERMCKRTEMITPANKNLLLASILAEPCINTAKNLKAGSNIGDEINYICRDIKKKSISIEVSNKVIHLISNLIKMIHIDKFDYPLVTIECICKKTPESINLYNAHQMSCGLSSESFNKKANKTLGTPSITTGKDLIKSGIAQGKHMKFILREVREKELRGEIKSVHDGANFAHKYLNSLGIKQSIGNFGIDSNLTKHVYFKQGI